MMESVSLTKGCFVHKPEKHKKKKVGNHVTPPFENALWDEIDSKIQEIEENSYAKTFDSISKFVSSCFSSPFQPMDEVPAAVLVMGVNMSDHSNIFNLLEKHLNENDICNTVILESRKCSNISMMLHVVVVELIKKLEKYSPATIDMPKKQECSFAKLIECYESHQKKITQSPRKGDRKNKTQVVSKPIVLLIQDVESFSTEIMQELVMLSKIYSGKLPIMLVFGMASAMVTLHSILPQKALCCLGVETFYSASATEYLTRIIEEVIISPEFPFKFGPKFFRMIVDTVLYHDFSVSNLRYILKYALIKHLYGEFFSHLCCRESDVEERVHELNSKELQALKELPSVKVYLENNPRFNSCLSDSTAFKESLISFVQKLYQAQRKTLFLLKILHCFVSDLPGYPLGKQLRELYCLALEKEICLTDAFAEALKLLKIQSQQSLKLKLETCQNVLKDCDIESSLTKKVKNIVDAALGKLNNLTASDFEKNIHDPLLLQNEKITSRFQLQEKIQMSIKQKRSNFDALRSDIIDNFLEVFKTICPPSAYPLYEVFYFDDVSSVKKHLMAVPRVTSCYSFSNPQHYLKCSCCKITVHEEMQPSMPDICILYKLHLESGKLINLCDWLEAFKSIKGGQEKVVRKPKGKSSKEDDELNIRFLLAVSELQMLGFIKSTKRKTDHVARVTFGSF